MPDNEEDGDERQGEDEGVGAGELVGGSGARAAAVRPAQSRLFPSASH